MTGADRSHIPPLCSYLSTSTSFVTFDSHTLFADLTPPWTMNFMKKGAVSHTQEVSRQQNSS